MLTRVLIVMLAVLNMGVALWWWLRPQPAPSLPTLAADVAVLELLAPLTQRPAAADTPFASTEPSTTVEISSTEDALALEVETVGDEAELASDADALAVLTLPESDAETEVENTESAESLPEISEPNAVIADIATIIPLEETPPEIPAEPEAAVPRCISLGPFTEMTQVQAALRALGSDVQRFRLREMIVPADIRYRILIPPAPSRAQAEAEVERISAAGFSDYFIINEGEDIHAIALGQFRNRQGAQSRLAELKTAGFAAQLHTTTEAPHSNWWIDTIPAEAITPATLQRRSNAAQWQALDCARLR